MSGIDYLLDTNFILGLLKSNPETLALINDRQINRTNARTAPSRAWSCWGFQESQVLKNF